MTGFPQPMVTSLRPALSPQAEAFIAAWLTRAAGTARDAVPASGWLSVYGCIRCAACGTAVLAGSRCRGCGGPR